MYLYRFIPAETPVGIYCGIVDVVIPGQKNDYAWELEWEPANVNFKHVVIDGRKYGNYMRFINDGYPNHNVKAHFVPYKVKYIIDT